MPYYYTVLFCFLVKLYRFANQNITMLPFNNGRFTNCCILNRIAKAYYYKIIENAHRNAGGRQSIFDAGYINHKTRRVGFTEEKDLKI